VAAAHLDLDLDHAHPRSARHDHLVQAGVALTIAARTDQGRLDPEPILEREIPAGNLAQRLLEVAGLHLGQEADASQVDAQCGRRRIARCRALHAGRCRRRPGRR